MIRTVYIGLIFLFFAGQMDMMAKKQPTLPPNYFKAVVENGDTLFLMYLPEIYVYGPLKFKSQKQEQDYWRLVRDVKRTLPYAKLIYATLIETYEFIETLPTKEAKQKHLKRMEKDLFEDYKPVLKKLSYRQGKLLIRLIDRECNQTSYELIKAFLGPFRAGFWQAFGAMFGASLKTEWDPNGKDALLESIVVMVEQGAL